MASDGQLSAEQTFSLVVNDIINHPPEAVVSIDDKATNEGEAFSYTLPTDAFTDIDGDTLTYSATLADGSALPSWLTFNAATQTFTAHRALMMQVPCRLKSWPVIVN